MHLKCLAYNWRGSPGAPKTEKTKRSAAQDKNGENSNLKFQLHKSILRNFRRLNAAANPSHNAAEPSANARGN